MPCPWRAIDLRVVRLAGFCSPWETFLPGKTLASICFTWVFGVCFSYLSLATFPNFGEPMTYMSRTWRIVVLFIVYWRRYCSTWRGFSEISTRCWVLGKYSTGVACPWSASVLRGSFLTIVWLTLRVLGVTLSYMYWLGWAFFLYDNFWAKLSPTLLGLG